MCQKRGNKHHYHCFFFCIFCLLLLFFLLQTNAPYLIQVLHEDSVMCCVSSVVYQLLYFLSTYFKQRVNFYLLLALIMLNVKLSKFTLLLDRYIVVVIIYPRTSPTTIKAKVLTYVN